MGKVSRWNQIFNKENLQLNAILLDFWLDYNRILFTKDYFIYTVYADDMVVTSAYTAEICLEALEDMVIKRKGLKHESSKK